MLSFFSKCKQNKRKKIRSLSPALVILSSDFLGLLRCSHFCGWGAVWVWRGAWKEHSAALCSVEIFLGYQVDVPRKQLSTESGLRTGAVLRTHGETCPVNSWGETIDFPGVWVLPQGPLQCWHPYFPASRNVGYAGLTDMSPPTGTSCRHSSQKAPAVGPWVRLPQLLGGATGLGDSSWGSLASIEFSCGEHSEKVLGGPCPTGSQSARTSLCD